MWTIGSIFATALLLGFLVLALSLKAADLLVGLLLPIQKALGLPKNVRTGAEGMIGQLGTVLSEFQGGSTDNRELGKVRVRGEIWNARTEQVPSEAMSEGSQIRVTKVEGLCLVVVPETGEH
jgi:membrane-bound ClpP family serine protease